MENKDLLKIADTIERNEGYISKLKIFEYDTLDEADPSKERVRSDDITVEIGGPSTHIKFTILTRKEHTIIKDAVTTILFNRRDKANKELDAFCKERIGK